MEKLLAYSKWKELLGIILIIIIGLVVRLEDLRDWKAQPQRAMYKGEPLLTTFDGYYYLTLARDLATGTYGKIDYRRAVPDYPKMPSPPPLLSVLGATIHKITGASFNWIGAVLPAFLGILLTVPLYLMARFYGGVLMAFVSSLVGILSFYYIYRSSLGWFDTDCMNVTWALLSSYLFLKFGIENSHKRYLYCFGGFITWILFMWWWDQTPYVATALSLLPFIISIVFFYRPNKKEGILFLSALLFLFGIVLLWKGADFPIKVIENIFNQYNYISKKASADFPNLGITISEQSRATFNELILKTTNSNIVFFAAIFGLILLFIKRPKDSLFLSVPVALSILSYFFAKRFLIFMSPITAMGAGYFIAYCWNKLINYKVTLRLFLWLLIIAFIMPSLINGLNKTFWPKEPPHLVDGMVYAGEHTPKDAVIWAWWDHGYPLIYFSNRGTVNDGSAHSPERSVYNGVPLATSNQRFAANFMRFYVSQGLSGISKLYKAFDENKARAQKFMKKVLSAGPKAAKAIIAEANLKPVDKYDSTQKWLEYFFPRKTRPVYLFLDWRLIGTSYWWFWLGSWDIEKHSGIHPTYVAFYDLQLNNDIIKGSKVIVDINSGTMQLNNRKILLKRIIIVKQGKIIKRDFTHPSKLNFELLEPAQFGAITDSAIGESVFNKLFLRYQPDPRYFRPLRLLSPSHQIWEVVGDSLG